MRSLWNLLHALLASLSHARGNCLAEGLPGASGVSLVHKSIVQDGL